MKLFLFSLLSLLSLSLTLASPALAQSQWSDRCATDGVATIQGFECLFANILRVVTIIAGLIFLFMFISGGFQYLLSGNDPKKVGSASSTLTLAFVGLIGIIASWLILQFIENFTGVNVTDFVIPG
ncbi:hypothetical protein A3K55_01550 [Candidatus Shapirobacteria bacterium RBG_13_44_7]|uniref:TrbC/VIRB2 family protein n=1 Tax=Candidatus Shapirobacteria bacterium RBG_13_44_7 TaxID=1802149 RepID=A0A1F7SEV9_9BACT|nr:MAG: hypothetical protein A3K55_01550 [Candidatus Shapirobacteria bacterium RBG_13_44_7]